MGFQQKLEREYVRGYQDGQGAANDTLIQMARNSGIIQGAKETWDIIESMIPQLEGIGPKTTAKIMKSIQTYAKKEKAKLASK